MHHTVELTLTVPKSTSVREADCVIVIKNSQCQTLGELYHRVLTAD